MSELNIAQQARAAAEAADAAEVASKAAAHDSHKPIIIRDVYIPAHELADADLSANATARERKAAEKKARKAKIAAAKTAARAARRLNAGDFWGRRWNTAAEHAAAISKESVTPKPVFCFAFWLAIGLAIPKVYEIEPIHFYTVITIYQYLYKLVIAIHADLVVATVVGLIGWLMMYATSASASARRMAWLLWLGLCLATLLYGAISSRYTRGQHAPLDYTMMQNGGVGLLIMPLLKMGQLKMMGLVVGVPLLYVFTAGGVAWIAQNFFPGDRRPLKMVLILAIATYAHFASAIAKQQFEHSGRYVAQNPHWILLKSTVSSFLPTSHTPAPADRADPADPA